jgi:uncharacterized protein (DUF1778 family)
LAKVELFKLDFISTPNEEKLAPANSKVVLDNVPVWPYNGRTVIMREETMTTSIRARDKRLEVRTTLEERDLINRAVEEVGTDLTTFVVTNLVDASRQVLADRDHFVLSREVATQWDKMNELPARELDGLRRLMSRPSPFGE